MYDPTTQYSVTCLNSNAIHRGENSITFSRDIAFADM